MFLAPYMYFLPLHTVNYIYTLFVMGLRLALATTATLYPTPLQ